MAAVIMVFITGEWLSRLIAAATTLDPLMITGLVRVIQTACLLGFIIQYEGGLSPIGLSANTFCTGVTKGVLWSVGFGAAVGILAAGLYISGHNPLQMVRMSLSGINIPLLLIVGAAIAPIFEEICFRGIFYTYLRRIGSIVAAALFGSETAEARRSEMAQLAAVVFAIGASTLLFVLLHSTGNFPISQIVGGLVFALAYETSRNLMVPITIHALGNLALFCLNLPGLSN
jgi:membrane protease YdiL (CAAX protease family)